MNNELIKMLIGSVVRNLIVAAGGFLTAHGIPSLLDGTITNLTDVIVGGVVVGVGLAWSMIQKNVFHKQVNQ